MDNQIDDKIDYLHKKTRALVKSGSDEQDIVFELKLDGVNEDYAKLIIENVLNDMRDRSDFWKLFIFGLIFTVGGLFVNIYSYTMAVVHDHKYFYIMAGIVVFGVVLLARAWMLYKRLL